jgi:hypothetical protein
MRRAILPLLLLADVANAFAPGIGFPSALSRSGYAARATSGAPRLGNAQAVLPLRRGAVRPGRAAGLFMTASIDVEAVEAEIKAQGDLVRAMKEAMKADESAHTKAELTAAVDKLKALKAKIAPPEEPKKAPPAPKKQPQV